MPSLHGTLTQFCVIGLRGHTDIEVDIKEDTLVIVGENGSGKTTFLRIMFYFLSGRFSSLLAFKFTKITAIINGTHHTLRYSEIQSSFVSIDQRLLATLPPTSRQRIRQAEMNGLYEEAQALMMRYLPPSLRSRQLALFDENSAKHISDLQSTIISSMKCQILYLPTYRRIERELNSIFSGIDPDEVRRNKGSLPQADNDDSYIELVEFGMADVQKAINATIEEIRVFANAGLTSLTLSYLGEVVNQEYRSTALQEISNASEETVSAVLNRVGPSILNDNHKQHLREIVLTAKDINNVPSEHEQIIYHYFSKLLRFQSQLQEREKQMVAFCELCSRYITDKKFVYDGRMFAFRIEWAGSYQLEIAHNDAETTPPNTVSLSDLSSGEKQIVSLFSHLYLTNREKFFVLIDEPELSLSVPWQRRFLEDIRKGAFCAGLVAVTHSPFIYDNSLRKSTHALGEFLKGPDWGNIK